MTRARILDAAWGLLGQRGAGISLAAIASKAGVSRQAVYLHFGDRTGLFVAVGEHIDVTFGRDRLREHVFGAPSGVEALRRWVDTMSWYNGRIDSITRILEAGQGQDEALAAVWQDRMAGRRGHVRRIVERIAAEGQLSAGWTVAGAGDLVYSLTLPGAWRVMTEVIGWSEERWASDVWGWLERTLLPMAPVPTERSLRRPAT